uniref:Uncharacterized protein n=1 Tax=Oryza sativa subsp. japonica TaxID=39947 RepID=Q69KF3_ORYSJ|nr:hypothetical protein [Oryza sativa Japonica Group]BAD36587.1 hypothetical protein [Oryza sativa Japonica Group]
MVGGGAGGGGGDAGDGGLKQEAAAAMAAVVPANFGEGGSHGEHQWSKGSTVVAAARPGAAWSSGAPCSRRRSNRAATPGGGAGGTPASDWMGNERGKGVLSMANPFLPSISEDLQRKGRGGFEEVKEVEIAVLLPLILSLLVEKRRSYASGKLEVSSGHSFVCSSS